MRSRTSLHRCICADAHVARGPASGGIPTRRAVAIRHCAIWRMSWDGFMFLAVQEVPVHLHSALWLAVLETVASEANRICDSNFAYAVSRAILLFGTTSFVCTRMGLMTSSVTLSLAHGPAVCVAFESHSNWTSTRSLRIGQPSASQVRWHDSRVQIHRQPERCLCCGWNPSWALMLGVPWQVGEFGALPSQLCGRSAKQDRDSVPEPTSQTTLRATTSGGTNQSWSRACATPRLASTHVAKAYVIMATRTPRDEGESLRHPCCLRRCLHEPDPSSQGAASGTPAHV